jgi:hypothetical protein
VIDRGTGACTCSGCQHWRLTRAGDGAVDPSKMVRGSAVQSLKPLDPWPLDKAREQTFQRWVDVKLDGEIRVTDPVTGGQKGTKPVRFDLIPADFNAELRDYRDASIPFFITEALTDFWQRRAEFSILLRAAAGAEQAMGGFDAAHYHVARVYGAGAAKYSDNNWLKGYAWSLSYAAALRHLDAIKRSEMMDAEMGVPHYAAVWFHCAALWTFATEGLGTDDRPAKV